MAFKTKSTMLKIAMIIFAGILDFGINYLCNIVLKVPLFLDTTFMIALLFIFGPVESLLVYLVTVSVTALRLKLTYGSTQFIYLYVLSAITIISITWFLIKRADFISLKGASVNRIFLRLAITSIIAAVACSVVSGFISYFTYQQKIDDWAFDKIIFSINLTGGGIKHLYSWTHSPYFP